MLRKMKILWLNSMEPRRNAVRLISSSTTSKNLGMLRDLNFPCFLLVRFKVVFHIFFSMRLQYIRCKTWTTQSILGWKKRNKSRPVTSSHGADLSQIIKPLKWARKRCRWISWCIRCLRRWSKQRRVCIKRDPYRDN